MWQSTNKTNIEHKNLWEKKSHENFYYKWVVHLFKVQIQQIASNSKFEIEIPQFQNWNIPWIFK